MPKAKATTFVARITNDETGETEAQTFPTKEKALQWLTMQGHFTGEDKLAFAIFGDLHRNGKFYEVEEQ